MPPKFGGALTVAIGVEPSGRELIDRRTKADLDKAYEMAAQSKLAQPAAK